GDLALAGGEKGSHGTRTGIHGCHLLAALTRPYKQRAAIPRPGAHRWKRVIACRRERPRPEHRLGSRNHPRDAGVGKRPERRAICDDSSLALGGDAPDDTPGPDIDEDERGVRFEIPGAHPATATVGPAD